MGSTERRNLIMKALCRRRHDTVGNLADEFGVSVRTICRDIEALSLTEPIYTQSGRYSGGIYVVDDYYIDRIYMTNEEITVLQKAYNCLKSCRETLFEEEMKVFKNIILNYTKPTNEKGKKNEKRRKNTI